ncbi:MAG: DNA-directed RNA polymerase subunit D [Candidatus Helarchaeota archaeon]
MNIRILEKTNEKMKFIIEGFEPSFVNALRRIMLAEVPTLAIEDVWFVENTSPLYDEIIAKRLGLIPIKTDLETFVLPNQCGCGGAGCPQCQVAFTLRKEAIDDRVVVYSGDLQSQDPESVPYAEKIPILYLEKGQKIVLEAYAKLGLGMEHAKWQSVGTCSFSFLPIIDIDYEKCTACGICAEECPRNVIKIEDDRIFIQNMLDCSICKICENVCEENAIKIGWNRKNCIFKLESTGALPAEKIVIQAATILKEKGIELREKLDEIEENENA